MGAKGPASEWDPECQLKSGPRTPQCRVRGPENSFATLRTSCLWPLMIDTDQRRGGGLGLVTKFSLRVIINPALNTITTDKEGIQKNKG